jgi:IclR family acetate operon transcriptional repressor
MADSVGSSGVQSLNRAFDLIEAVADAGGRLSVGELADLVGLPLSTTHRLLQTLVALGYMRQLRDRRYALGFRLVPLGAAAHRLVGAGTERTLSGLVSDLGETANLAILAGDSAEYVAQVPSSHSMRMFTEVGRRVDLHSTGVGKALLAQLTGEEVDTVVRRAGLTQYTANTIGTKDALHAALSVIRERGYALDNEEQEIGVRCVAVAAPPPMPVGTAISVSGPLARLDDAFVARAVPLLHEAAVRLA